MTRQERARIASMILSAIESSSLSRYEIAKRAGVTEASLSRFVNGKTTLSIESIEKIAPVLGLELVLKAAKKR